MAAKFPIMATYIGEFANSARRGRFALGYQLLFTFGLLFTGLAGVWVVPTFGWQWMFIIGALPALIAIPLRWLLPESPRWLASRGRFQEADAVLSKIEAEISENGARPLPPIPTNVPAVVPSATGFPRCSKASYLRRSLTVWAIWFCSYSVVYGLSTWMPSIFRTVYQVSVQQSVNIGFMLSAVGVVGALIAVSLDRFRRAQTLVRGRAIAERGTSADPGVYPEPGARYGAAAGDGRVLLYHLLAISLSTYTAELYPTEMRALGCGVGNAWLRFASVIGPYMVGAILPTAGISAVYMMFGGFALLGGIITLLFAVETRGRVLEELSPSLR